jgi:hypothetical protein
MRWKWKKGVVSSCWKSAFLNVRVTNIKAVNIMANTATRRNKTPFRYLHAHVAGDKHTKFSVSWQKT